MFRFLKDIIAPKRCYSCNKEGHFLCENCLSKLSNFESICYVCKSKSNSFQVHESCLKEVYYDKIVILSHYKDKTISKLIKDLKFYGKKDIAEDFGLYLSRLFLDNEIYKDTQDYIIVYPPMGFIKKLNRGYNQAETMSRFISKEIGIKIHKSLIKKVKRTKQQSKLNRNDRLSNLTNSFSINKRSLKDIDKKTIIIVDDVVSTGTTINEISKLLKQSGVKKVIGLIVASD